MKPRRYKNRLTFRLPGRTLSVEGEAADEARSLLENQAKLFRLKFGREPGPDDPIFFDPFQDTPQFVTPAQIKAEWNQMLDKAEAAGIPAEQAYAARKTGIIASTANWDLMRPEDQNAWLEAVEEYRRKAAEDPTK